jgi:hypothetical protein
MSRRHGTMNQQYCPECGHENPVEARFCMDCGYALSGRPTLAVGREPGQRMVGGPHPIPTRGDSGTDWAGIAAAVLAFLSLRHMSRRARQTTIAITFLVLFFGCPMACGTVMFVVDSFLKLFQ